MKDEKKYVVLATGKENYIKFKNRHYSYRGSSGKDSLCKVDGLYVAEDRGKYFYCLEKSYDTFGGGLYQIEICSLEKKKSFGDYSEERGWWCDKKIYL